MKKILVVILCGMLLAALFMFTSCDNIKAREERKQFVKDSTANAENIKREKLEKELFGDVQLGMNKNEILSSQFFNGSIIKSDDGHDLVLENKNGYDVHIDGLQFKFIRAKLWYKVHDEEQLRGFILYSEYNNDHRQIVKDVYLMENHLCEKYGAQCDYQKFISENEFSYIGDGYKYRELEYGKYGRKKIRIKLHRVSSMGGPYSYAVEMNDLW